jgi:tripartite-type tricarboxylate transporter receptor subunit TctC
MVKADSPFKTFEDVVAYAKKNPGQFKWGHPGRGVTLHMSQLIIFKKLGVQAIDIPFKGAPEMATAVLGGHLDAAATPYGAVSEHVRAGKTRFLMFYTDRRYSDPPNVPTAGELGYPEAVLPTHVGFYAHRNTAEGITNKLIAAFKKASEDPEVKKGIEKVGEQPRFGGPEFIYAGIKKTEEIGIPILKEIGLYVGQ